MKYNGTAVPLAIAYPPDWTVEEDDTAVRFRAPRNGTAILQIIIVSETVTAQTAEQARDDFWAAVRDNACTNSQVQRQGDDIYSGIGFAELLADCGNAQGQRTLYLATALGSVMTWGIIAADLTTSFDQTAEAVFDPMLKTLNLGVRRNSQAPSVLPPPTATRATASTTPGTGVPPRGAIPTGWRSYSGTMVPFAIAYPPDWRVDDTNQVQGHVNFIAPDGVTTIQIRQAGSLTATLGIDRLRETYMADLSKQCGVPARAAGYNVFAGIRFAALRIDCTASGKTIDLYYGTGIKDGNEWTISLIAPADAWEGAATRFFGPILDTLNIPDTP